MINGMITMWSQAETKAVGIALVAFVLSTMFLYLCLTLITKLLIKEEPKEKKFCRVDADEFNRIGREALRTQRMKSFIAETELGDTEVIKQ